MANALSTRATSLGVSALVVGAALIAALTATISVQSRTSMGDPTPIFTVPFPQPPHTTPPPSRPTPPQPPQASEPTETFIPTFTPPPLGPATDTGPDTVAFAGPVEISNPFWAHKPSNLDRFYPARAISRGIEGSAQLDCLVAITGTLSCTVVAESPAGWGFGDAALRIAHEYSMQPAMRNGTPVAGHYRMNVPFTLH